jgi:hypothetical protein
MFLISDTSSCADVLVAFGVIGGVTVTESTGVVDFDSSVVGTRSTVMFYACLFFSFTILLVVSQCIFLKLLGV